jgi:hypothetical protein
LALRIFETDPESKPKPRFTDDAVGRFYSGRSVNNLPESLENWRVMTGDMAVANDVAHRLGGTPEETDSASEHFIEVLTEAPKVLVVVDAESGYYSDMKLWNRSKLVHHCDGVEFLSPDDKAGKPCGCPSLFAERKQAARDFMGPSPSITIRFRLADDYELGEFKFQTGSWSLAEVEGEVLDNLSRIGGEVLCELSLELVEYNTKKGRAVSYRKPVLKALKSYTR